MNFLITAIITTAPINFRGEPLVSYTVRIERSITNTFTTFQSLSINSITKKEKPMMVFGFDMAAGKFTGCLKSLKLDEILNVYKVDEYYAGKKKIKN